ncbi:MAG: biotin/lipoate A/B protein ligase family protein [Cyanobacteria bacterium J06621_8]
MNTSWRYIPPLEASGAVQMAIDRYLLEQHYQGRHPPTLRFYTWQPAALSLGYHQHEYPESWQNLTWQGQPLELVRRPTGGRAVLHQGDLTYAVVTSMTPGKRLEVYRQISQFLIEGWRSLGVELNYGIASKEYIQQQNCFATATGADLVTVEGAKLIGSAQLRRRKTVLQHGSMMLTTDRQLYQQVFKTELPRTFLSLLNAPNHYPQAELINTIIESLIQAAIAIFKIDLVEQPLSTREWQDIANDFSLLRY